MNDEDLTLVAVSVKSIKIASYPGALTYDVIIRGESRERAAAFTETPTIMAGDLADKCRDLHLHGFTVVELPNDWRYKYDNQRGGWREAVIQQAMKQVAALLESKQGIEPSSGYDSSLAEEVLEVLDRAFPSSIQLIDLKHQLNEEPSDDALSIALDGLKVQGFINGQGLSQNATRPRILVAMANVQISGEGKRYLQEEMRRKTTQSKQAFQANDASALILQELLSEFRERKLTSQDLLTAYKGLAPNELKQRCLAENISDVDFDLAMRDLDVHGLVKTGPMVPYDHPPGSLVTILSLRSKREYAYLTVGGYKEASKSESMTSSVKRPSSLPPQAVFHGDQIINYGHAGAIGRQSVGTVNHQEQWATSANQIDLAQVVKELGTLKTELLKMAKTSADYQHLSVVAEAEQFAEKHDGPKLMETLSKSGKWLFDFATHVGTDVTAKLLAKAMGIES